MIGKLKNQGEILN